jgi:hypothetical protein
LLSVYTQQSCHMKTKGRELGCEQGKLQLSAKERGTKVRSCYGQQSSNLQAMDDEIRKGVQSGGR